MLTNIQILRAFAALAVVAYHTNYRLPGLLHTDFLGVSIFFVISGFIMSYISRETAAEFLKHRIVRIVPLYWIGTCLYAAMVVWIYPRIGKPTDNTVTLSTFLQDMFFIPRFDHNGILTFPVLGVGWTLNLEMYFYALFAVMLFINQRFAPFVVGVLLLAFWVGTRLFAPSPLLSFLAHDYVVYFVFGIAAFYLWQSCPKNVVVGAICLLLGCALLIAFAISGDEMAAKLAPFLIVFGAVILESAGFLLTSRIPLLMGAASYALYLFHPFVMGLFGTVFSSVNQSNNCLIALLAIFVSSVLAVAIHWFLERPISSTLRKKLRGVPARLPAKSTAR